MTVTVTPIDLGFDRCYVLQGDGVIVIDGGAPKKGAAFRRGLERAGVRPGDVKLIVLTHGHWDHIGSAGELKAITGATLALHEREVSWLEQSLTALPPGVTPWGRVLVKILGLFMPLIKVPAAKVDMPLGDEDVSLADYGIPGRIVYTPGHSSGSVSVLLDGGEVFVGDLAMNKFPLRLSPGLPILAEDPAAVVRSWKSLLERGVTTIYPAHGNSFSADGMRQAIDDLSRKPASIWLEERT